MTSSQVVIARTPDVSLEDLERMCFMLEKHGVTGAPLVFPIEYPLEAFDWDEKVYDSFELIKFFRRKIGFEELPLIVMVSEKSGLNKGVFCDLEAKTCLVIGFIEDFSWIEKIIY